MEYNVMTAAFSVPANINIANAQLPQSYEAAKTALANCESIDECQTWANKAEALASYARMADDDTLRKHADRIQARAVRKAGELLKTFDGRGRPSENNDGAVTVSQTEAARAAGMSDRQQHTAVRVANVPQEDFETAVESGAPPTVTKLADMGTNHRMTVANPEQFQAATKVIGAMRRCVATFNEHDAEYVAKGVGKSEINEMREAVQTMDTWLDRFVINLPE